MINAIVQGIFFLITKLFDFIMSPIISLVTALFPSLGSLFSHISTFLGYCFTYVRSILELILIPNAAIVTLFDYFVILYSIYLIVITIRFIITVYNKLKL